MGRGLGVAVKTRVAGGRAGKSDALKVRRQPTTAALLSSLESVNGEATGRDFRGGRRGRSHPVGKVEDAAKREDSEDHPDFMVVDSRGSTPPERSGPSASAGPARHEPLAGCESVGASK